MSSKLFSLQGRWVYMAGSQWWCERHPEKDWDGGENIPHSSGQTSQRYFSDLIAHKVRKVGISCAGSLGTRHNSVTLCVARLTVGLVLASVPPGKHPCSLRRCWCSQESAAAGNATIMPTQCKDYKNVGFIFSLFLFTQRSINVPKSGELERNQIIHSVHLLPWWNHVSLDTRPELSVGPVLPTCSLNGLASLLSSCSTLKVQKQKPVLPWLWRQRKELGWELHRPPLGCGSWCPHLHHLLWRKKRDRQHGLAKVRPWALPT